MPQSRNWGITLSPSLVLRAVSQSSRQSKPVPPRLWPLRPYLHAREDYFGPESRNKPGSRAYGPAVRNGLWNRTKPDRIGSHNLLILPAKKPDGREVVVFLKNATIPRRGCTSA